MRTILLLGVATASLLLAGRASGAELPMTAAPQLSAAAAFGEQPRPPLDYDAPAASTDTRVYTGPSDRVPSEVEYRRGPSYPPPPADATFSGSYDAEGRWTGTWDGSYETEDGRRFDGVYEGTVEGRPGIDYPPPPYDGGHSGGDRHGYDADYHQEMVRRCGRGGTAGGAVVGGIVGGIAGNRIAGRGDRTAGTLIGGGLGALAGAAIGNAADREKCERWWAERGGYSYRGGYYPGGAAVYHHGYGYGYGWYSPGMVVTTVIVSGEPVVTETVETRTYYEKAPVRKRHAPRKRWKPKPKPRCVC